MQILDDIDAFATVAGMVATGQRLEVIERFIAGLGADANLCASLRELAVEGCRAAPAWTDISDFPS